MKILLDTHIFLWLLFDTKKIPSSAFTHLENTDNTLYLSAISVAEIEIKKSIGQLEVQFELYDMLQAMGIELLDFNADSALLLGTLPFHHKDPFDRMLITQAKTAGCKIITVDSKFQLYDCELV